MIHIPHKPAAPPPTKDAAASPAKAETTPAAAAEVVAKQSSKGPGYSGVAAHDDAVASAELTRQNAVLAAAGSQSAINTAAINYHRSVAKSALANGVSAAVSMSALRSLGVTGL
jgi:hypothetical protein